VYRRVRDCGLFAVCGERRTTRRIAAHGTGDLGRARQHQRTSQIGPHRMAQTGASALLAPSPEVCFLPCSVFEVVRYRDTYSGIQQLHS